MVLELGKQTVGCCWCNGASLTHRVATITNGTKFRPNFTQLPPLGVPKLATHLVLVVHSTVPCHHLPRLDSSPLDIPAPTRLEVTPYYRLQACTHERVAGDQAAARPHPFVSSVGQASACRTRRSRRQSIGHPCHWATDHVYGVRKPWVSCTMEGG